MISKINNLDNSDATVSDGPLYSIESLAAYMSNESSFNISRENIWQYISQNDFDEIENKVQFFKDVGAISSSEKEIDSETVERILG